MRNLIPHQGNAVDFHNQVVDSKRDRDLIARLHTIGNEIEEQFAVHQAESNTNSLERIGAMVIAEGLKSDLRTLYHAKRQSIIRAKNEILTDTNNRKDVTCQYCTINSVQPIDHIMPQASFPEFSVHLKNLFPCCGECNGYKTHTWLRDGQRQFLNLYLDTLPNARYLFVELDDSDGVITTNFFLENKENIEDGMFQLIERHYTNMHLCRRFNLSSNSVITNLRNMILSLPNPLTREEIQTFVLESSRLEMEQNGFNYWKSVLSITLSQHDTFLASCNI